MGAGNNIIHKDYLCPPEFIIILPRILELKDELSLQDEHLGISSLEKVKETDLSCLHGSST